jgi:hypothetical protein
MAGERTGPGILRTWGGEAQLLARLLHGDRPTMVAARVLLLATLALIVLFVLLSFLRHESWVVEKLWRLLSISRDNSIAENFTHGLAFLAAVLFMTSFVLFRARALLFCAALYGFAWLDDSAQYHERVGKVLSEQLGLARTFGLRGQDLGEIVAWLIAAAFLAPLLLWALRRRRPASSPRGSASSRSSASAAWPSTCCTSSPRKS